MKQTRPLFAAFVALASACSHGPAATNAATTKTISTDLPDTGTVGPTKLYFVESGILFRGVCASSSMVIKSNCLNALQTMDYATFRAKLDNGLSATVKQLAAEVAGIEDAMASVESDIKATSAAIDAQEQALGATTAELTATRADIARLETFVGEYRDQLKAIGAYLARMENADLASQATEMAGELQALLDNVSGLYGQLPGLLSKIKDEQAQIAGLADSLNVLDTRLTNLMFDHKRAASQLQFACDDYASYQLTLGMLTDPDGINFRIQAEDLRFQKARQFVKRFEAIFAPG